MCVNSVFDCMHFVFEFLDCLLVVFILPYILITSIYTKVIKMQKIKVLRYYIIKGMGCTNLQWGLQEIKVLVIYYNHIEIMYKKSKNGIVLFLFKKRNKFAKENIFDLWILLV